MRELTLDDLEDLSLGSAILGSGGGGNPAYFLLMAKYCFEKFGPAKLISIEELKEDDFVIPLSFMGAPLINMERLISGRELENLLGEIEDKLQKKPTVIMPAEIGGANAFTPLLIASKWGIPILDADMMGRAFPELQMSSCYLKQLKPCPAVMADCMGNTVIIEAEDAYSLERIARSITVSMGSSSSIGFYFMGKNEVLDAVLPGSFSQALYLGKILRTAQKENVDPIEAVIKASQGTLLCNGKLIGIKQSIEKGFLEGSAEIIYENEKVTLYYQNEFLLAKQNKKNLGETPDLLVLLEENSGRPLTSEMLQYGLQVALIKIPSHEIWKTAEGLNLVGAQVFFKEEVK